MTPLQQLDASLCHDSFFYFFERAFKEVLDPACNYIPNWHLKYCCDLMQKEVERIAEKRPKEKDFIINIPVRSGKSLLFSVALNAWAWIKYPSLKFISASYAKSLSMQLSTKTRDLIKSDWYQVRFGHIYSLKDDSDTKTLFETSKGGLRFATSTGASVTGIGGDIIIADDLVNPEEANSLVQRQSANEWYDITLWSRLNNPAIGSRVVVMQRLHEKDLTGHLLEKGNYEHICIPAEATSQIKPKELVLNYTNGLFFEKRFTGAVLEDFKKALTPRGYFAQMLQSPKIESGNIINTSKLILSDNVPTPIQTIQCWDTAFKTGEQNDYSVCATWYRFKEGTEDRFFLADIFRGKIEFPELKRKVSELNARYKPQKILIEDKASGQSLYQELKRDQSLYGILTTVLPDRDKVARAYAITPIVDAGHVYINSKASWVHDFMEELSHFDSGEHDDQVDAFCYGLQFLKKKEPRIIKF